MACSIGDRLNGGAMKSRVISESCDFGVLCSNHAQTTPDLLTHDHTQFINSPDVSLNEP